MMLIPALLVIAFIAALVIFREDGEIKWAKSVGMTFVLTILMTIAMYALMWLDHEPFVGIMGGLFRVGWIPIGIMAIVYIFIHMKEDNGIGMALQAVKLAIVAIGLLMIITTTPLHYQELRQIPQVEIHNNLSTGQAFIPTDAEQIRVINRDMAAFSGNKALGSESSLGSQFEVRAEDFTIQNVNDHLYWVAPLQFRDFWKWMSADESRAFVMVDAVDKNAPAKLISGQHMKYLTSSYFSKNIERHVYFSGYSDRTIEDVRFEITDGLVPRYVISLTNPTVVNDGAKVTGVLVVNLETGTIEEYTPQNVPAWVDRIVPEHVAHNYLKWYGLYRGDWVNSWLQHNDTMVPTLDELWFVHNVNGQGYWFSGMTSSSSSDQSLVYIAMMNTRDGKVDLYKTEDGGYNEHAALEKANGQVSLYKNCYCVSPIPYNFAGRLVYVMPVVSDVNGGQAFQMLALMDVKDGEVKVGSTKAAAFNSYKLYLNEIGYNFVIPSSAILGGNMTGTVMRISSAIPDGSSSHYNVWVNESNIIFAISSLDYPEVSLTNPGDKVNLSYDDTGETLVAVNSFDNQAIDARVGEEQKRYAANETNRTEFETNNWDRQEELRKELDDLQNV